MSKDRIVNFIREADVKRGVSVSQDGTGRQFAVTEQGGVYMRFGSVRGTLGEALVNPRTMPYQQEPYRLGVHEDAKNLVGMYVRFNSGEGVQNV